MLSQIDDGFEVAFNKSFVAIQSSDWEAAEELLLTAERKKSLLYWRANVTY